MSKFITKKLRFLPSSVSCLNCLCNYPTPRERAETGAEYGGWCQIWSHPVDDTHTDYCQKRAVKCKQWIPRNIDRTTCGAEEDSPDRWYEKDSMG